MKRAAAATVALLLLAPLASAETPGPETWLTPRLAQTFTAPDGTRYVFSPDGRTTLVERPDGVHGVFGYQGVSAAQPAAASAAATESASTCGGLYYTGARYYNPCLGIFLTRDPAPVNPTDPWTLNPYVYGKANPLRYVDPTGRQAVPPDDVFFREQELRNLPPAEQARIRAAEAREQVAAAKSGVGGLLGTAEFFGRAAWGTAKAFLGYRYEEAGEQIVETLSDPGQAFADAKQSVRQTVAEVERLSVAGQDIQAGRVLARDVVAPATTAALSAGEMSVAAGRRMLSLPKRVVPIQDALASEGGAPFIVAEDGAQLLAGRSPARGTPSINLIGERARAAEAAVEDLHAALRARAQAIHGQFHARAQTGRTTAVAILEDPATGAQMRVYAVSGNRTAPAVRAEAAAGGEIRVTGPGGHAEQIITNYAEEQGLRVRAVAPSRAACGPSDANCAAVVRGTGARLLNPEH